MGTPTRSFTREQRMPIITGMLAFILLAFVLYRNNRQKQKANTLLFSQKEEIESTETQKGCAILSLKSHRPQRRPVPSPLRWAANRWRWAWTM